MQKSLILVILFIFLFTSCGFKNPLNKKTKVSYVECPKTLILLPASKIIKDGITLILSKNYTMNCYTIDQSSTDVIIDYNLIIDVSYIEEKNIPVDFEFKIFATNKQENDKLFEKTLMNTIQTEINSNQIENGNTKIFEFNETLELEKVMYDKGLKLFIGIF